MTRDQVKALLGEPDQTSLGTYGSATPHPWQGLEWIYRWQGSFEAKSLHVVFAAAGDDQWVVNDWQWWDF
jgi:hypothetical protein